MSDRFSRREWMRRFGVASGAALVGRSLAAAQESRVLPLTSTSEVTIPPRGHSFMKFSFDFPEPSVEIAGLRFAFLVFTHENCYGLDASAMKVTTEGRETRIECSRVVWAGGQESSPGRIEVRLRAEGDFVEWDASVEMGCPIKSVTTVIRGVPRGRISSSGQRFFDPGEDEVLLGYPFSGGDLFGPGSARGMTTPLALLEIDGGRYFFLSSLDSRVRPKRFYFQPGERTYRVEAVHEVEGWKRETSVQLPAWRVGKASTLESASRFHFDHIERAYGIPRWEARSDVPEWLRGISLVVTLHGMHFTGYVFNDYARMLEVLEWIATRIPPARVLAFLSAWDGRYYWDYPLYEPAERMGGEEGFGALIRRGQELGFRMMPMFGANAANRKQAVFEKFADGFTAKIDGDRADLNWVDWDNDRHQDGWLSYMNLGVESWRRYLTDRIASILERYGPDAYFLDIVGGFVNNPQADMHQGTRLLVEELRRKYPKVLAVGEMHYDALLSFIPFYHSFSQTELAPEILKFARFFQHLSHPAPGRGSTGVHEAGFQRWNPETLSLAEHQIPTLNVVDDTLEKHRLEMEAVIRRARERARL